MSVKNDLVILGVLGIAAYFLYSKATAAAKAAGAAYTGTVNSFSDWLSNTFGPSANLPTFYTVTFPDATTHAVNSNTVDSQGNFTWTGYPAGSQPAQDYQIIIGSDGAKYAISG